jgi:hypothetical protein
MPKASLMPGEYDVTVTNPGPVDCTSNAVKTLIVPPPSIMALVPPSMCNDDKDKTLTLEGDGFVVVKEAKPTVKIGTTTVTLMDNPGDCMPAGKSISIAQSCKQLKVVVPKTMIPGLYDVTVTNPEPVACSATSATKLSIAPIPTVTSVEPPKICSGGSKITVKGTGFWVDGKMNNPTVDLVPQGGGMSVPSVAVTCKDCDPAMGKAGTTLQVQIGPGAKPGTTYDVTVTNPAAARPKRRSRP